MNSYIIHLYRTGSRKVPFNRWFESLDRKTQTRVEARLDRLEAGNWGDAKMISQGVYELRLHFGPGYRIYFARIGKTDIMILNGGDKSSQQKDIVAALFYYRIYQNEQISRL